MLLVVFVLLMYYIFSSSPAPHTARVIVALVACVCLCVSVNLYACLVSHCLSPSIAIFFVCKSKHGNFNSYQY